MANLTYNLILTEVLVMDKAPKQKRMEFTPSEALQAVEAGATMEMRGEKVGGASGISRSSHYYSTWFY